MIDATSARRPISKPRTLITLQLYHFNTTVFYQKIHLGRFFGFYKSIIYTLKPDSEKNQRRHIGKSRMKIW
jgi:hypothetical protein